jgi:hypothetical protein
VHHEIRFIGDVDRVACERDDGRNRRRERINVNRYGLVRVGKDRMDREASENAAACGVDANVNRVRFDLVKFPGESVGGDSPFADLGVNVDGRRSVCRVGDLIPGVSLLRLVSWLRFLPGS